MSLNTVWRVWTAHHCTAGCLNTWKGCITCPNTVKTSSSQSGPDEGGKCDSIGLSAACPSKVAMIHTMVVAVTWAKANQVQEWLWALSCIFQHESLWVKGSPKSSGLGRDREDGGQRYRKYLSWLSDWGTRDKSTTTYTTSGERDVSGQIRNQGSYVWGGTKYVMRVKGKTVKG